MKTILVPVEHQGHIIPTLETAFLLGTAFGSYIEGFALRPAPVPFPAADVLGASIPDQALEPDDEAVQATRKAFEDFMKSRRVPRNPGAGAAELSFGWVDDAPAGDGLVGSYGRVFDVTVVGRPGTVAAGPRMSTLEAALFESGRPILIAPPDAPQSLGRNVLIAWNGSTETARTIAFAMPLLRQASRVVVLTVEGSGVAGPTGDQVARHLRLNGIAAEAVAVAPGARTAGEAILAQAAALGSDLLVKGAYTQSRLRQIIFGGATRHIILEAELPVLMAH